MVPKVVQASTLWWRSLGPNTGWKPAPLSPRLIRSPRVRSSGSLDKSTEAFPSESMDVATFERSVQAWVAGGIVGCTLALAALALTQRLIQDAQEAVPPELVPMQQPDSMPFEHTQPQKPHPFVPEAKPTPEANPIRGDAIRRLRVLQLQPTAAGLAKAVGDGGPLAVKLYLNAGIPSNATNSSGDPVLLIACEKECRSVVAQLLEAGANPNFPGHDGRTPLMAAAGHGDTVLMETLIQHRTVPEVWVKDPLIRPDPAPWLPHFAFTHPAIHTFAGGFSPTVPISAATTGDDSLARFLDQADAQGHTALNYAVAAKSAPTVKWLIEKGASLEGNCCGGDKSLLLHALDTGDIAIIAPVLEGLHRLHPLYWSHATREALYAAMRRNDKAMVRLLLDNHSEPPTPEGFRQPLLAYAIAWGNPAVLQLLLECGADPNTPIGSPVERPFSRLVHDEINRYYLEKEPGMTLLMLASGLGRLDFVQMLLQYGAKRGALTGKYKMAAISFAAEGKHPEVMQVLLGKSPRQEDQDTRVDISLSAQRAVLWKANRVAMTTQISTGRYGYPTPAGRFVVTDKDPLRFSTIYKVKMPYFMRLSCSEVGMHAGDVPDYPASHGCIRLPREAAIKFFHTVDLGTLVTINR